MKTEAIKSMQKVVGSSGESSGRKKRTAAELKQALAYEERRRREIAEEKTERNRERARIKREKATTGKPQAARRG